MDGTVLIADDDRTIRTVLTQALTRAGCRVHATSSLVTLKRWVEEGRGDLVISDVVMPDGNGLEALPEISRMRPDLPVIVISAQNTIMTAIQAAEAEAFDYLPKPFDLPELLKRAARGLERKRRRPAAAPAPRALDTELPLVGHTPAMQALYRLVARVLNSDIPVLVTGESGTGKSLIARSIHEFSERRDAPRRVVGADALASPEAAAELISGAQGGTLIIEEVADLDDAAQARLARLIDALDAGGPTLIATSRRDLGRAVREGAFREDLFYRLAGVSIAVPSLRERIDDIVPLAEHFLARAAERGQAQRALAPEAAEAFRAHPWPGNVRELENLCQRLAMTGTDPVISGEAAAAALGPVARGAGGAGAEVGESLGALVERHLKRQFDLQDGALPPPGLHGRVLREVEAPLIEIALAATGGNQARAAALLGINRNTLRKKITELGIEVTRRRKLM